MAMQRLDDPDQPDRRAAATGDSSGGAAAVDDRFGHRQKAWPSET